MRKLTMVIALTTLTLGAVLMLTQKTYAQAPQIEWKRNYGLTGNDGLSQIQQTTNGGYILGSSFLSINYTGFANSDFCAIKTNYFGGIQWRKYYGGSGNEVLSSILQTNDTGYILVGSTNSNNGDVIGNHNTDGENDIWVVKIDKAGTKQWTKCYGGSSFDYGYSISKTTDGGYIIGGETWSQDGDIVGCDTSGWSDACIIKIDSQGNIEWQKCYGGSWAESVNSVTQTNDGGYIFTGSAQSSNGDVIGHDSISEHDMWIVKLDASGNISWQQCLGGSHVDVGTCIKQTYDNGYIICGYTDSPNNGDVVGNHGWYDYWVIKLKSNGNVKWKKCFGDIDRDFAYSIQQTNDSGYIVCGLTYSWNGQVYIPGGVWGNGDAWIIKLGEYGGIQWKKLYGSCNFDYASSVIQTSDGGYAVGCVSEGYSCTNTTFSTDHGGGTDSWFIKLGFNELKEIEGSSINDIMEDGIKIFPNPTTDILNIELQKVSGESQIFIYDLMSKVVYEGKCGQNTSISMSDLTSGIYFVKIQNDSGQILRKIIKE